MLKYPEPTPCPVHTTSPQHLGLYAVPSSCTDRYKLLAPEAALPCDDTQEINFTTELQTAAKQAKPRRGWSRKGGVGTIAIHEDTAADGRLPNVVEPSSSQQFGNARSEENPARPRRPVDFARYALQASYRSQEADLPLPQNGQNRMPASLSKRQQHVDPVMEGSGSLARTGPPRLAGLRKEPRRRTIYVPSEDTTVLTIHPGLKPEAQARSIADETSGSNGLSLYTVRASTMLPANMVRRTPRQSLAIAPKRAPLQPMLKPVQERFDILDRPGQGAGKENVPPGVRVTLHYVDDTKNPASPVSRSSTLFDHNTGAGATKHAPSFGPKHASSKTRDGLVGKGDPTQPLYNKSQRESGTSAVKRPSFINMTKGIKRNSVDVMPSREKRSTLMIPVNNVPSKLLPALAPPTRHADSRYPLLSEDISRPEMFEEAWLSDKEAAITQLINGIFQAANAHELCRQSDTEVVRRDLLQLYQKPSISLLYNRLQASLLCGALSIPSHRVHDGSRLSTDVGLRRKLLSLWTKTYHLSSLRAAAEVVIGREARTSMNASGAMLHAGVQSRQATKRDLEAFLDSCLIRNEDSERWRRLPTRSSALDQHRSASDHEFGSLNWSLRRTILRSLMMILLLDNAKELGMISSNLFCASSSLKSSASVLRELFSLLLPSAGDFSRPLMHLGYKVCYIQFPLSEYEYEIRNLATDLRDGVRLTRLVELLLYPSIALALQAEGLAIAMPTGEILISESSGSWVLSQHLRFPCVGRTQRLYNAQIALSALHSVKGVNRMVEEVKAEDIVDGYREKTIAVLWGLVGKWGLESLIDVVELRKEVRRLEKQRKEHSELEIENSDEDSVGTDAEQDLLTAHTHLLKAWASAIGRRHGVVVYNLTTAFSDGRVFEKIVDEYSQWHPQQRAYSAPRSLGRKLKALGCSDYFGM